MSVPAADRLQTLDALRVIENEYVRALSEASRRG
jgi:hypothetical protein